MKKFLILILFVGLFACGSEQKDELPEAQDSASVEISEEYKEMPAEELKQDEVPDAIKETIEYQFANYKVKEFEKFANGNYKVKLEKDNLSTSVVLSSSGKIIKILD